MMQTAPKRSTEGEEIGGFAVFLLFAAFLFLPSAGRYLFAASSLTAGLLGACAIVVGIGLVGFYRSEGGRYWQGTLVVAVATAFVITLHSLIAALWFAPSLGRSLGSLAGVIIMLLTAYQVRTILRAATAGAIEYAIMAIAILFAVIAALSLLEIQPAAVTLFSKPIFPFTEPSHFALTLTPFLVYQCVRVRLPFKLLWLGGVLVLAYLLQNLTLVISVAVAAVCCLPGLWLVGGLTAVGVFVQTLDLTYFTDRLDFGSETTNLSALVYIQGVELMKAAWGATSGWGIGFQQLGIAPINVPTSDLIYRISQDDANLRDGGFLAAKLIAELGIVGVVLVLAYVWIAVRALLALRYRGETSAARDPLRLFVLSVIVAFSEELFIRGLGYFSGTALLLLASLILAAQGGYLKRRPYPKSDHA